MMTVDDLLQRYEQGPQQLADVLRGLPESHLDQKPIPDRWSIRQVVCHLADAEIIYADRLKRVLVEDNPTMADWSPEASVREIYCRHRDPQDELQLIERIRHHTAAWLKSLDVETWQRTGVHSTDGPMTLETLMERIIGHIPHHIQFIEQKRLALESA